MLRRTQINLTILMGVLGILNIHNTHTAPLHDAVAACDIPKVKSLIEEGANVNAKNTSGQAPIHIAAKVNCVGAIEALTAAKAVTEIDGGGLTPAPIHIAAIKGNLGAIEALLKAEADPNAMSPFGTPLHLTAGMKDRVAIASALLQTGAKIAAKGPGPNGKTPLDGAVYWGDTELARFLLSKGAQVNAQDFRTNTPLHNAAALVFGDGKKLVRLLLEYGANPSIKNKEGQTPYNTAIKYNNNEIARIIQDYPGDIRRGREIILEQKLPAEVAEKIAGESMKTKTTSGQNQ